MEYDQDRGLLTLYLLVVAALGVSNISLRLEYCRACVRNVTFVLTHERSGVTLFPQT